MKERQAKNPITNKIETIYEWDDLKIAASAEGIEMLHVKIDSREKLERFAELVSVAWQESTRLLESLKLSLLS